MEHLTVDQVTVRHILTVYPLDVGISPLKATFDPIYGVILFMLKQTCLAICAPLMRSHKYTYGLFLIYL